MRLIRGNNKKGVTLVELIISMILITIVAVVSMGFFVQYFRLALKIPAKTIVLNCAQERMEYLYMDGLWRAGNSTSVSGVNVVWTTAYGAGATDYAVITVTAQSNQ